MEAPFFGSSLWDKITATHAFTWLLKTCGSVICHFAISLGEVVLEEQQCLRLYNHLSRISMLVWSQQHFSLANMLPILGATYSMFAWSAKHCWGDSWDSMFFGSLELMRFTKDMYTVRDKLVVGGISCTTISCTTYVPTINSADSVTTLHAKEHLYDVCVKALWWKLTCHQL